MIRPKTVPLLLGFAALAATTGVAQTPANITFALKATSPITHTHGVNMRPATTYTRPAGPITSSFRLGWDNVIMDITPTGSRPGFTLNSLDTVTQVNLRGHHSTSRCPDLTATFTTDRAVRARLRITVSGSIYYFPTSSHPKVSLAFGVDSWKRTVTRPGPFEHNLDRTVHLRPGQPTTVRFTMTNTFQAADIVAYRGRIRCSLVPEGELPRAPSYLAALTVPGKAGPEGWLHLVDGGAMTSTALEGGALLAGQGINDVRILEMSPGRFRGFLSTVRPPGRGGDIYSFRLDSVAKRVTQVTKLNTAPIQGQEICLCGVYLDPHRRQPERLYFAHQDPAGKGARISSLPTAGGPPTQHADLAKIVPLFFPALSGTLNAAGMVGQSMVLATWDPSGTEQLWVYDTLLGYSGYIGKLPATLSTGGFFGPVALLGDGGGKLTVVGALGDLADVDTTTGTVSNHRHTGRWDVAKGRHRPNLLDAGALSVQTDNLLLGTRDGGLDVAVGANAAQRITWLTGNRQASITRLVTLPTWPGTSRAFGKAGPGSGGRWPVHFHAGSARLGSTWRHGLGSGPPNGIGVSLLGVSRTGWLNLGLPFDLGPLGAPGNALRVSADLIAPLALNGDGVGWVGWTVPDSPALFGATLYSQALVTDPGANTLGLVTTGAAVCTVGD